MNLPSINLFQDIYFSKKHISLYLKDNYELFEFEYTEGSSRFYNLTIKRPITKIGGRTISEAYYDLETAYGYGGYLTNTDDPGFIQNSLDAHSQKCVEEKIIAEFIRFHPYNRIVVNNKIELDFLSLDREAVTIDLTQSSTERWSGYSGTTRNTLRKNPKDFHFLLTNDIDKFIVMYENTMRKNDAEKFYYFKIDYFTNLLAREDVKLFEIVHKGQTINMSFIILGKEIAYYHLSANDSGFSNLNGNYHFIDQACEYLKAEYPEISLFHLGGGRTVSPTDSLLAFKSKFSNIRDSYFIAGKIFNPNVYNNFIEEFNSEYPEFEDVKYFLKYRMEAQ